MRSLDTFIAEELDKAEVRTYGQNQLKQRKQELVAIKCSLEQYEKDNSDDDNALLSYAETLFKELSSFSTTQDLLKAIKDKTDNVKSLLAFYAACDKNNSNRVVPRSIINDVVYQLASTDANLDASVKAVANQYARQS